MDEVKIQDSAAGTDQVAAPAEPAGDGGGKYAKFAAALMLALKWGAERGALVAKVHELEAAGSDGDAITAFLGQMVDDAKEKAHAVQ